MSASGISTKAPTLKPVRVPKSSGTSLTVKDAKLRPPARPALTWDAAGIGRASHIGSSAPTPSTRLAHLMDASLPWDVDRAPPWPREQGPSKIRSKPRTGALLSLVYPAFLERRTTPRFTPRIGRFDATETGTWEPVRPTE